MNRPTLVYVSGPLTTGTMTDNIRAAIKAGIALMERGYVVIVPHEKALMTEILYPQTYDQWMAYDYKCILRCDALLRIPGASNGGDLEVAFAVKHGIPVYMSLDLLFLCQSPVQTFTAPDEVRTADILLDMRGA